MKLQQRGLCQMARTEEGKEKSGPVFVVRLKATNADGVRALRAFLKAAWRRHGLKALSVTEEKAEEVMPS
jgi:hypothetical protein